MPGHHPHRCAIRSLAVIAILTVLVTVGAVGAASAAGDDGSITTWGIRPSSATGPDGRNAFHYDLQPGDSVEDFIGVSNFGDEAVELTVYASDAFNTAAGDFDLLAAAEAPVDVGAWIAFADPVVTVPARTRLDIPFRLSIPANATPGDHAGGIVASLVLREVSADDSRVAIDRRVGARIYLRVAGDVDAAATITDLDVTYDRNLNPAGRGTAEVTYTVTNTGNVRLSGTPTIEVEGPFGIAGRKAPGDAITELLPGNHLTFRSTVTGVSPLARLTTTVTLDADTIGIEGAGPAPTATASATNWAMPWTQIALVALAIAAALTWRRRRRQQRADLEAKLAAARAEGRNERAGEPTGDRSNDEPSHEHPSDTSGDDITPGATE